MQNNRNTVPSSVWQRRTNRMIAAAIIVIGLTMMISNISQCIYIGMLFIILALLWLAWLTMKERKLEPPRPSEDHPSPVLFLVTSQVLPRINRPTIANPSDKPPSYDQILSLDGHPPDYSSVMPEKPPRYEDLTIQQLSNTEAPEHPTIGKDASTASSKRKLSDTITESIANTFGRGASSASSNTNRFTRKASAISSSMRRQSSTTTAPSITRRRHNSNGVAVADDAAEVHGALSLGGNGTEHQQYSDSSRGTNPLTLHPSTLQQDTAGSSATYLDPSPPLDTNLQTNEVLGATSSSVTNQASVADHVVIAISNTETDDQQNNCQVLPKQPPLYRSTPV